MKDEAEKGYVKDLNCHPGSDRPRIHEIPVQYRDGEVVKTQPYKFLYDQAIEMPMEHALKFLHDQAFEVCNAAGQRLRTVKKRDPSEATRLTEGETIAEWEELTKEALFNRAKVYPGSEALKAATPKDDLIAFIKNAQRRPVGEGVRDQPLEYDIEGEALAHMLPKPDVIDRVNRARAA